LQVAFAVQHVVLAASKFVKTVPAFAASQKCVVGLVQVTAVVPPHLVLSSQQQVAELQEAALELQYTAPKLVFNL
jgi:hypothetical protein